MRTFVAFLIGFILCSSLSYAVPRVTLPGGASGKVAEAYMADASITAQSFEANPADCAADRYATAIAADGDLTCSQVSLTAGVSGTLPIANGGTNSTGTPTAGGIAYGTGTAYAVTAAGSGGDCLKSGGAGAPTWGSCSSISAYGTIEDEGTPLTQRTTLNFAGAGVTCADDTTKTTCTIAGSSGAEPGGAFDSIQYRNDAGTFSGATYASIDPAGTIRLEEVPSTPSAPSTGTQLYAVVKAGRRLVNFQGPSGLDSPLQPGLFSNTIRMWYPSTGTAIGAMGMAATVTATASHPALATTNRLTSMSRFQFATAGTAGSSSGVRANADQIWRGNAAGLGGWFFAARCVGNLTTANGRGFVGAQDATAVIGNVNPSTLLDTFYFGFDSAQTTWRFCTNDNAGAATCTDLGANFPTNLSSDMFEFRVFAKPNDAEIFYYAERLGTGATTSGSVTTDLPRNTVLLAPQVWVNNGTDASANQMQCNRVYIESDI